MSTTATESTLRRVDTLASSRSTGIAGRTAPLVALLLVLLTAGCGGDSINPLTRTGSRPLGSTPGADGPVTQALTRIPVPERQPAPVAAGPALSGEGTVSTADFPGKVVLINVWGAWCAPCRLEAPDLAEASRKRADTAAFVGINVRESSPQTAQAFLRTFDIDYPHIYDPSAAQLVRFAGTLPPNGIPTTLFIDRQGRIAARVVGVVSLTTLLGLIDETYEGK